MTTKQYTLFHFFWWLIVGVVCIIIILTSAMYRTTQDENVRKQQFAEESADACLARQNHTHMDCVVVCQTTFLLSPPFEEKQYVSCVNRVIDSQLGLVK